MLASRPVIVYQTPMVTRRSKSFAIRPAFAGETVRALFSTLLLLGLSGDRRAR
jgi:hypothetical protein